MQSIVATVQRAERTAAAPELAARARAWATLCRKAAGYALSGKRFSTEDRVEVAARIMLAGVQDLSARYGAGALPTEGDPAHGFKAYYRRASRERERLDKERAHLDGADVHSADFDESTGDGAPDASESMICGAIALVRGPAITPQHARAVAHEAVAALSLPDTRSTFSFLYGAARAEGEKIVAAELDLTLAAYRERCKVAKRAIVKLYPSPESFIQAIIGTVPIVGLDARGELLIRFVRDGAPWPVAPGAAQIRGERATGHAKREREPRAGTVDGDTYPDRDALRCECKRGDHAQDCAAVAAARAACRVRRIPAGKLRPHASDEDRADALSRLSFALSTVR